jgi:hypothetical protein
VIRKFIPKPIVVEMVEMTVDNGDLVKSFTHGYSYLYKKADILWGYHVDGMTFDVPPNKYFIAKDVDGSFMMIPKNVVEKTYDEVKDD